MSNELFVISAMVVGLVAFPCCMFAGVALQTWLARRRAKRKAPTSPKPPRPKDRLDYIAEAEARRPRRLR